MGDTTDLAAKLEAAVAGTTEPPSGVEETKAETAPTEGKEAETAPGGKDRSQSVPYARFKEVVDLKNELQKQVTALQKDVQGRASELGKMAELLTAKEADSQLVGAIRNLAASDPEWRKHIERLDKRIRGIEEKAETGEITETEASKKTEKLLQETRNELRNEVLEQRAELLLQRADTIAEKYLAALPSEFTEEDKRVISKLWVDQVDWDAIDKTPDLLTKELARSLESTLKEYGTPRGAVAAKAKEEVAPKADETAAPKEDPVERLSKIDFGKLEEVKRPDGSTRFRPKISDQDFSQALAEMMRASRGR